MERPTDIKPYNTIFVINITGDAMERVASLSLDYTALAVSIIILAVVGIIGNVPVLIVYIRRKDQKASNTFIKVLAFLDLLVCACVMPYTIVYEYHLVTSDVACRLFELMRHFAVFASNITLVAIAAERYIAVCRIGTKINVKSLNKGVFCIFLGSVVLSLPAMGLFAVVQQNDVSEIPCTFPHELTNGKFCHFTYTLIGPVLATTYQALQMFIFFTVLIMIVCLYTIIYVVLWRKTKKREELIKRRESSLNTDNRHNSLFEREALIDENEKIKSQQSSSTEKDESSGTCNSQTPQAVVQPDALSSVYCLKYSDPDSTPSPLRCVSLEKLPDTPIEDSKSEMLKYSNGAVDLALSQQGSAEELSVSKYPSENSLKPDLHVTFQKKLVSVQSQTEISVVRRTTRSSTPEQRHTLSLSVTSSFSSSDRGRKKRYYHRRTARMLFLCTIIYFVTWVPFWLDIFRLTNSLILRYAFFIGNATNPIVYGIVNKQVRKLIKQLLVRCLQKCMSLKGPLTEHNWQGSVSNTSINV